MDKKYSQEFIKSATELDTLIGSSGIILKYATDIIKEEANDSFIKILCIIDKSIKGDYSNNVKCKASNLRESLIRYCGYKKISEVLSFNKINGNEDEKSLDELLLELDNLVGLKKVKLKVNELISFQKIQKLRREQGLVNHKSTLHLSFTGNPGTGKTTVARIVGRIYKQLGLLSKGHFTEVSRTDLIAGYQGQTALKVKKVIDSAKGGVLFIDEAYSITENEHSDSYGRECLTELTKALEDYREDMVVIVAGYTEPMKNFFESNPGLKSRFNTFIEFDDYNVEELIDILLKMCSENDYDLADDTIRELKNGIANNIENKEELFSNGRYIRNIFEDMIMNHSNRVDKITSPTLIELKMLCVSDIPTYIVGLK
jgi:SpoVK/Ycf46/Vps4 family AAA+-type ATPase